MMAEADYMLCLVSQEAVREIRWLEANLSIWLVVFLRAFGWGEYH